MMLSRVFTNQRLLATRLATAAAAAPARRAKSTIPQGQHYSNVHSSFKKTWLMDAGAYPIMAILSFAVTMCTSFTAYKFFTTPDNRVAPAKRTALLRYWE